MGDACSRCHHGSTRAVVSAEVVVSGIVRTLDPAKVLRRLHPSLRHAGKGAGRHWRTAGIESTRAQLFGSISAGELEWILIISH